MQCNNFDPMENSYQPEAWRDAFVMLGTSAAALIGLLFVVISFHLNEVTRNPVLRIRVRNNLSYLFVLVAEATLLLIPQPTHVLGFEFIVINAGLLCFQGRNLYVFASKHKSAGDRGRFQAKTSIRLMFSDLLGMAGGIAFLRSHISAPYLLTASYVSLFGSVVINAWLFTVGIRSANHEHLPAPFEGERAP